MVTTIRDLKGTFITMCAKSNGMPVGRTSFQDFEIAYLLNAAYEKCLKSRVETLARANGVYGENQRPHRDHGLGQILSELGELYAPTTIDEELRNDAVGLIDEARWKLWGPYTRIFEIPQVNGYFPYVIGADIHEVSPKLKESVGAKEYARMVKSGEAKAKEKALQNLNISYPVRILSGSEVLEFAPLLQNGGNYISRLPYRVGRVRTYQIESPGRLLSTIGDVLKRALNSILSGTDPSDRDLKTIRATWHFEQLYVLELLHPMMRTGTLLYASIERVMHPKPISEYEIKTEADRTLEVSFGFEIAEIAAQMAMGIISSGGQVSQQGAPAQQRRQQ